MCWAGPAGRLNLAGSGEDFDGPTIAEELDWYTFGIPRGAIDVTADVVGRIPLLAVEAGWLEALRVRC